MKLAGKLKQFGLKHKWRIVKCFILLSIGLAFYKFVIGNESVQLNFRCGVKRQVIKMSSPDDDKNELWKYTLDENQLPCQDFYKFTCGNFCPGSGEERLVLEKCSQNSLNWDFGTESTAIQKMRQYRDKILKGNDSITMLQLFEDVKSFGNCPLLDSNWSSQNFNLTYAFQRYAELTGKPPLFNVNTWKTPNGSFILTISIMELKSLRFTQSEEDRIEEQQTIQHRLITVLDGIGEFNRLNTTYLKTVAKQIVDIKLDLYNMTKNAGYYGEVKRDYNKYGHLLHTSLMPYMEEIKFDELDTLLPVVGGKNFFMNNVFVLPEVERYFFTNPSIYVGNKTLFIGINQYLKKMDKSLLANTLCSTYFEDQKSYLNDNSLAPNILKSKSDKSMAQLLQNKFGLVAEHLFVKRCVDVKTVQDVQTILDRVKLSSEHVLRQRKWLSNEKTLEKALLKLKSMKSGVAVQNMAMNVTLLDEYYSPLKFLSTDYFYQMDVKKSIFNAQRHLLNLIKPLRELGINDVTVDNAFYWHEDNMLLLGGGRLIPPNYDAKMPDSYNYATIGSTVGHEVFHGFEAKGINFNENGGYSGWMDKESLRLFIDANDCLVKQYGEIWDIQAGQQLNGTKTLNENMADHLGLQSAYHAYKMHGKEGHVQGYEHYTSDQSFFINYGLLWCNNALSYQKSAFIQTDEHSLSEYRVNEVTKNMPEFAKAFNCPLGSPMNPVKKCHV